MTNSHKMEMKKRKEREKNRRKDQILTAAIELIEEQGFEDTTMDEIANRAELSKGTLYLYFRDKSALHQSIKKKGLKIIHTEFLNILQEDIPGAEVVRKMALSFTDFILKNATFTRAMVLYEQSRQDKRDDYPIEKDCNHLKNELFMLIIRGLQIGIQDKSIHSNLHPKILGLHIAFELQGILQYSISSQNGHIPALIKEQDMTIHQMVDQFIQVQFKQQAENN